jgi:hypothetical protein
MRREDTKERVEEELIKMIEYLRVVKRVKVLLK